jgi:hypothetical protein
LGTDSISNPVWGNDQNTLHVLYPESAPHGEAPIRLSVRVAQCRG